MGGANRFMKPVKANYMQTYVSQYVPQPFELMQRAVDKVQSQYDAIEKNYEQQQAAILNLSSHSGVDSDAMAQLQNLYTADLEAAMDSTDLSTAESKVRDVAKRMGIDYKTGQLGRLIGSGQKEQAYFKGKEEARGKKIGDGGWSSELESYLGDYHKAHQERGIEMNPNVLTKVHRGTTDINKVVRDISGTIKQDGYANLDTQGQDFKEYYTWIEGNTKGVSDVKATAAIAGAIKNDPDAMEDLRIKAIIANKGDMNAVDFEAALASGEIPAEEWTDMFNEQLINAINPGVVAATHKIDTRKRKFLKDPAAMGAATSTGNPVTISNRSTSSGGSVIKTQDVINKLNDYDVKTADIKSRLESGAIQPWEAKQEQDLADKQNRIYKGKLERRRKHYASSVKGKEWIDGSYKQVLHRFPERFYSEEVMAKSGDFDTFPEWYAYLDTQTPTITRDEWREELIKADPRDFGSAVSNELMMAVEGGRQDFNDYMSTMGDTFKGNVDDFQEETPVAYTASVLGGIGKSEKDGGIIQNMNEGLTKEVLQQTSAYVLPNGTQLDTWLNTYAEDVMDEAGVDSDNYDTYVNILDDDIEGEAAYELTLIDKNGKKVSTKIMPTTGGWDNMDHAGQNLMKENEAGQTSLERTNFSKGKWMAANAMFREMTNVELNDQLFIPAKEDNTSTESTEFNIPISGMSTPVKVKAVKENGNISYELINKDGGVILARDDNNHRFKSLKDLKTYTFMHNYSAQ